MTASPHQHDDDLTPQAAAAACNGIFQQLTLVRLESDFVETPLTVGSKLGSVHAFAYIMGYSKAVHSFYEQTTGARINDGTMGLVTLSSIFRGSTIDECVEAKTRTIDALEAGLPGVRDFFAMGQNDYNTIGEGGMSGHSGLVALLGVGGMA